MPELCFFAAAFLPFEVSEESFVNPDAPDSDRDEVCFVDSPELFHCGCPEDNAAIIMASSLQRVQELHFDNFVIGSHVGCFPLRKMGGGQSAYPVLPISTTSQEMENITSFTIKAPLVEPDGDFRVLPPGPIRILRIGCGSGTRLGFMEVVHDMTWRPLGGQIFTFLKVFLGTRIRLGTEPLPSWFY